MPYVAAQLLGAAAGATLVWLHYFPHWKETPDAPGKLACFCTAVSYTHLDVYKRQMEDELVPGTTFVRSARGIGASACRRHCKLGDSGRMMMPAQELTLVKRPSGKNAAVTMRDVATQSGFSPATVSIVLNNAPLARYIAPATKKRIEEVARKLGYRPNAMARFLRSKRTHSVGVLFSDITDPFCTLVMRGIENTLYQASYVSIFADAHNQRSRFERYLDCLLYTSRCV